MTRGVSTPGVALAAALAGALLLAGPAFSQIGDDVGAAAVMGEMAEGEEVAEEAEVDPLYEPLADDDDEYAVIDEPGVWDPWEPMNRGVWWFNDRVVDRFFLEPVAIAWDFVLPDQVQTSLKGVYENTRFPIFFVNNLLQLKPHDAAVDIGRFVVNTTVGLGGIWDPATRIGLEKSDEDFGQTLGYWGVPAGPYLVIPILGPSSGRDAIGSAVDRVPFLLAGFPPLWAVPIETLDTRANTPFRYGDVGGAFEYEIVRFLAMELRKLLIAE